MRFEKFTNRLQQALSDAQSLAMGKDHTAIAGIHILNLLKSRPILVCCNKQVHGYLNLNKS
jgi:ATP-dependent Clp protease ATP-binding subunit ClpB